MAFAFYGLPYRMPFGHNVFMPKVTIKRADMTVETEVSFDQLKELLGVNGHKLLSPEQSRLFEVRTDVRGRRASADQTRVNHGDFDFFINSLSDRSKQFLLAVKRSPKGIGAAEMTTLLGFQNPSQLGGVTGPGLAKIAQKFGFKVEDIYSSVVTFPNNVRTRTFQSGKLLKEWEENKEEKPAV